MHLHEIVKIDAAAFSALDLAARRYGLDHETQTLDGSNRRLDPPDAGAEPGARRRRAGFEKGRLSAIGLV